MATAQVLLSGTLRVSSTSNLDQKTFSAQITCSTWQMQEILLLPNVSEFVVSIATLSAPLAVILTSTNIVRVNFSNHASYVSAASAGWQFKDYFMWGGSGVSGPLGLHFSNSGSDSATITCFIGQ
jgi:hypothetical protein